MSQVDILELLYDKILYDNLNLYLLNVYTFYNFIL